MKKLIIVLMALTLLVGVSFEALAADVTASAGGVGLGTLRTYTTINTSATYEITNIPITTIIPGRCRLVGYSANIISLASEGVFSIRDAASTTTGSLTDSYIIAENEASSTTPVNQMWPAGLDIQRGITIHQGAKTSVTVYYIEYVAP